jgi:hypothetical protein
MSPVVKSRKYLPDILDEFGKRRPPVPEGGNCFRADLPAFGKPFFKACLNGFVGKMLFGVHADYEMEVVGHDAVSEDICEIEFTQIFDEIEEIVLFGVPKGKTIQGGSGNDMIYGGEVSTNKPGDGRYKGTSWF